MLQLVSQSTFTAITTNDLFTHLNVVDPAQDSYLQSLLNGAVDYVERYLNMDLRTCQWRQILGQFPIWANYSWEDRWGNYQAVWPFISEFAIGRGLQRWQEILQPRGPLQTINSITYYDATNALQTLDPSQYTFVAPTYMPGRIEPVQYWPISYPRPDAVTITATFGYANVPPSILQAIKLLVGNWYSMRESANYGPDTISKSTMDCVENLLYAYRPGLYS